MKLYDWKVAPNPRRVRMFLAEKGIEMELVDVAGDQPAELKADYLEGSTHRTVPALELDDGTIISEAPVICRYLETLYPDKPLLGRDAKEDAEISTWDRKAEQDGMAACAEVLRNKVKVFAGRALPGYTVAIEQIPALIERGQVRMAAFYDKLNERLADREFIAGNTFSMADITAFCAIDMARQGKMDIPESCPNVKRWYEAVAARPSAKA